MDGLKESSLSALLFGTFTIAALHALIPSHWLAFALVGRAQRWSVRGAVGISVVAGLGHAILTTALGLLVAGVGKGLQRAIPPRVEHATTSAVLVLLGIYFLYPALRGRRGGCRHAAHTPPRAHPAGEAHAGAGDAHGNHGPRSIVHRLGAAPSVMGILALGMTLSPCLDLLSVYVAAAALPWPMLLGISLLMTLTTVTIMGLLVWLAMRGLELLRLNWLEQNESLVVGTLLVVLGAALPFLR